MALQIVDIAKEIIKLKQDIDEELHDEDQNWTRNDSDERTPHYILR
jgi:hypothetical protein